MPHRRKESSRLANVVDTREQILDVARQLFVTQGFERTTMRRIAQAIGYTPTTIYLYFKDKEALLRELVERDFLALVVAFTDIVQETDPIERLRQLGITYTRFGLAHPNQYRFMFMSSSVPGMADDPETLPLGEGGPEQASYAFLTTTVEACIHAGRLRPEYQHVDQVAQMMWGAVHGVIALYIARHDVAGIPWQPPLQTAEGLIDVLVRGLTNGEASDGRPRHQEPAT